MSRLLKAAACGLGGATVFAALAFGVFPGSLFTDVFLSPVVVAFPFVAAWIPEWPARLLVPEGGPAAGVLMVAIVALGVWALPGFGLSLIVLNQKGRKSENAA